MRHWFRVYWPLRHPTKPRPYLVSSKPLTGHHYGRVIAATLIMLTFAGFAWWLGATTGAGFAQTFGLAFLIGAAVVAPIIVLITPPSKGGKR